MVLIFLNLALKWYWKSMENSFWKRVATLDWSATSGVPKQLRGRKNVNQVYSYENCVSHFWSANSLFWRQVIPMQLGNKARKALFKDTTLTLIVKGMDFSQTCRYNYHQMFVFCFTLGLEYLFGKIRCFQGVLGTRFGSQELKIGSLASEKSGPYKSIPGT